MIHQLVNPAKALRTLRKTPVLLDRLLRGLTQAQAATLRDGGDRLLPLPARRRAGSGEAGRRG
jgi:hypothetical protein